MVFGRLGDRAFIRIRCPMIASGSGTNTAHLILIERKVPHSSLYQEWRLLKLPTILLILRALSSNSRPENELLKWKRKAKLRPKCCLLPSSSSQLLEVVTWGRRGFIVPLMLIYRSSSRLFTRKTTTTGTGKGTCNPSNKIQIYFLLYIVWVYT
jgi:hypothetical protein